MSKIRQFATLGAYLKTLREKANLTQKDVAVKIGYSSPQFISNLERGAAGIPAKKLARVATTLNADKKKILSMLLDVQKKKISSDLKI